MLSLKEKDLLKDIKDPKSALFFTIYLTQEIMSG
jgi:hypothetical protein